MSQPQAAARILVVEDEKEIAGYLRRGLASKVLQLRSPMTGQLGLPPLVNAPPIW